MNKEFWRAALIRAVRTVAQTAVATIGTTAVIEKVKWLTVLSASALAGILSLLTSIATGLPEVERGEDRHPPDEEEQSFQELIRGKYREDYLRNVEAVLKAKEEQSNSPADEGDDNEESCPVTVLAYPDYDDEGNPIVDYPEEGEDDA